LHDGALHGLKQAFQALLPRSQCLPVPFKGKQQVETGLVQDVLDFLQAKPKLAQEQDLLQAQHSRARVQTVAVARITIGLTNRFRHSNVACGC
jgi:hypothetical protein